MRLAKKKSDTNCFSGDIVDYKGIPCMVVLQRRGLDNKFLLVAVEGSEAGTVIKEYDSSFEVDTVIDSVLLKKGVIVISGEE